MSARHGNQRRGKGGRTTPRSRVSRAVLEELAAQQAVLYGCRCVWSVKKFEHRDGYSYAQVVHDDDCPAANRRGYGLVFPKAPPHG